MAELAHRPLLHCLVMLGAILASEPALPSSLRVTPGSDHRAANEVEADYATAHLFIDERVGQSVPITVYFDPQAGNVAQVEVFTNVDRREFATAPSTTDGVEEGIVPPPGNSIAAGDERHYYHALPMQRADGGWQLVLSAGKTGAYRLTARYRLATDPPGTWHWYGDEQGASGITRRDYAVVVSPSRARDIQLYEANPLTVTATGTAPEQRGTFAAMTAATTATDGPRFNLDYLHRLGVNALWLQPVHPRGIDGRLIDPTSGRPYEPGSPYAVKNYFAVMPLLASGFHPGAADNDTPAGRTLALGEFHGFVAAAAARGIGIFLDVPFNHTAHDVELGPAGLRHWGHAGDSETTEIRAVEARVFSRSGEYDLRASGADNVAAAPDRFDFGKWADVVDVYFGRYAALVPNQARQGQYQDEGDWFDTTVGDENTVGSGHFDRITQRVWQFFGDYLQYWLDQADYSANPQHAALDVAGGILGLRADFAQGLPPQAWEYLINRTRARRWDFTFMAETLDGGKVGYRSMRHFDVLNDSLVRDLQRATTAGDMQGAYDARGFDGGGLILLNTTSQDEDSYSDPYQGALRFAVNSAMGGVTMILAGQELGARGTIVPPSDASNPAAGPPFGYERYLTDPFSHPLWNRLSGTGGDAAHLFALYAATSQARAASPALRGAARSFLTLQGGGRADRIFAVGKVETPGGDPAISDVVFAFINLDPATPSMTPPGMNFDVNVASGAGNLFGIRADHRYNVKNSAAIDANARNRCLWGPGLNGADLLRQGIFVALNRVPSDEAGWASAPFEAQYLKLIDLTASPGACG